MEKVLPYIESNKERYLAELKEFLAIPSVSSQKEHDAIRESALNGCRNR